MGSVRSHCILCYEKVRMIGSRAKITLLCMFNKKTGGIEDEALREGDLERLQGSGRRGKAGNSVSLAGADLPCNYVIFKDLNCAIFSGGKGHKKFAKTGIITSAGMLMFFVNGSGKIDVATFGASESLGITFRTVDAKIIRGMLGLG